MSKKTKTAKPTREWIGDWTVSYEWEWRGELLSSRRHDFRIESTRRNSQWFMFSRYVVNNDNGKVWVDGFDPQGGFVSYRPEQIIAVRPHKEVKKRNDSQPSNGSRGAAKGQSRKRGTKTQKPRR